MVKGLEHFKKHFASYSDKYTLIGGTACTIIMEDKGLGFRATKDLDIVLHIEALNAEFIAAFWTFIKIGEYKNRQKSTGKEIYYRFSSPTHKEFPSILELFSRVPNTIQLREKSHLTPLSIQESVTSLSAILLDDDYYQFIHKGKQIVDGLPIVDASHLIPLKARAWIDLVNRKNGGEIIDEKDIRKHINDILRLHQLLTLNDRILLPQTINEDMRKFVEQLIMNKSIDLKNLDLKNIRLKGVISHLQAVYDLK